MISIIKVPTLNHLLCALCAGLILVNVAEWLYLERGIDQSRQIAVQPVDSNIVFDQVSVQEFSLPPKQSFSEIVERPLLIPGRRPLAQETEDSIKPVLVGRGKIQIKLMGIIMTPKGMNALLQDGKGAYLKLPVKGTIDGWELDELYADRVVLKQDDAREELKLYKPRPKNPIRQARNLPQPKQQARLRKEAIPPSIPETLPPSLPGVIIPEQSGPK